VKDWARPQDVYSKVRELWRPPPELSLSEWADQHFYLSAENAAEPGRWKTIPYQKGIMDAISDPGIVQVTLKKSARVGYTKMLNATVGYYIDQDPATIMVVQPTVDDGKGYSKEELAPMFRDCPKLHDIIEDVQEEFGIRDSGNTLLHKKFPGGVLDIIGANSGTGFRRKSRRVVLFDEVDGYPPSAGSEGDQIKLGIMRSEYYHNRKILAGSTPLLARTSRIDALFEAGDQRRYYVPCPHCQHFDYLVFREPDPEKEEHGHWMHWPKNRPKDAAFICFKCGCEIEHKYKRDMVAGGEWRAAAPFTGHASFHIWAAYSYSPNAFWGQIASEFLDAKDSVEKLKTFVNTVLGETWSEKGEAPEWERLYQRREQYPIGSVPAGVRFLTCGVDVQKDRWVYEVVGWGNGKESWSIDAGVIPGDTSNEGAWSLLDELLNRSYAGAQIRMMAVDSGYNTQMVYNWARHRVGRVIATKGATGAARSIIGVPTPVDVTYGGRRIPRGAKVWIVGTEIAKSELYGWLQLQPSNPSPIGFCHFPEYGDDYFKQLTSEVLVTTVTRTGYSKLEWQLKPNQENHYLDCRILNRAASAQLGIDRLHKPMPEPESGKPPTDSAANPPVAPQAPATPPAPHAPRRGGWLSGNDSRFGGKPWLR
jgi:phage terminase large subunit GpA-like protein